MAQVGEPPTLPIERARLRKPLTRRFLDAVERVGDRVPYPVMIFVILIGIAMVLSHLFYLMRLQVSY
jgi:aminobenzoyl-glutamate transport protein